MVVYDIHFAIAGIVLSALIFSFISIHYPNRETVRAYQKVIIFNIIGAVSDAVTGYYNIYPQVLPLWAKYLLNSLCLGMGAFTTYAIIEYMIIYVKGKSHDSNKAKSPVIFKTLLIMYSAVFVVNVFTPIIFSFDSEGYYLHSRFYYLVLIVPLIYIGYSGWFALSRREFLDIKQVVAIVIYIFASVSGMIMQHMFFPQLLLIYYFSSIATMCMTFTLETPDYVKLMETMEELRKAKAVAESATKAKDSFLAGISHEVRTPLNAILGMNTIIIRETKENDTFRRAKVIKSAGNTLLSIINDLLDISKVESGMMELSKAVYRTSSVINDVRNMTFFKAQAKGLEFNLKVDSYFPAKLSGDEVRIRQIMLNLINNAIKYTPEGKIDVYVDCKMIDPQNVLVTIKVSDTGIGIRQEDMDDLFVDFKRLDEVAVRKIEGTGLGLPLAKRFAQMMGGDIKVESVYGEGSTFTAEIPQGYVSDERVGNINQIFERSANSSANEYEAKLLAPEASILVVDDNEMNLEVFVGLLNITEIRIDVAGGGEECLALCNNKKYDIIFLDQMMSGMDGIATLTELKKRDCIGNTPVIMFTADAVAGAAEHYLELGFNDFISKPVEYERIEELLYKYLPKEKIQSRVETQKSEDKKSSLLVVDDSKEKLDEHKKRLEAYASTFVRDDRMAEKYILKHDVDYVMITREEYMQLLEKKEE